MNQPESIYFNRESLFNRPFSWQSLRKYGSSKAVKSSYYWIFIIPLISRAVTHLHPAIAKIPGFEKISDFSLPFSWYVLYFGALSFALASLLYDIFCPRIISLFKNFREFSDSGYEGLFLADELQANVPSNIVHDSPIYRAFMDEWMKNHEAGQAPPGIDPHSVVRIGIREIRRENLGGIFYTLTEVVNHSHPAIMRFTGVLFYLGFGLLAAVLFQNINAVIIEALGGKPLIYVPF